MCGIRHLKRAGPSFLSNQAQLWGPLSASCVFCILVQKWFGIRRFLLCSVFLFPGHTSRGILSATTATLSLTHTFQHSWRRNACRTDDGHFSEQLPNCFKYPYRHPCYTISIWYSTFEPRKYLYAYVIIRSHTLFFCPLYLPPTKEQNRSLIVINVHTKNEMYKKWKW